jgi:hypothetical protein
VPAAAAAVHAMSVSVIHLGKPWPSGGRLHRLWFWKSEWPDPEGWLGRFSERRDSRLARFVDDALWGDWLWTLYCKVHGHQPIDDNCGKPGHRFCYVCNTATPGAPTR